jgi:hypothetical protein
VLVCRTDQLDRRVDFQPEPKPFLLLRIPSSALLDALLGHRGGDVHVGHGAGGQEHRPGLAHLNHVERAILTVHIVKGEPIGVGQVARVDCVLLTLIRERRRMQVLLLVILWPVREVQRVEVILTMRARLEQGRSLRSGGVFFAWGVIGPCVGVGRWLFFDFLQFSSC